jgi:hypothetical protein
MMPQAVTAPRHLHQFGRLKNEVFGEATKNIDLVSTRFAIRQVDQLLKRVEVKAKDLPTLEVAYQTEMAAIDPAKTFNDFKAELDQSIQAGALPEVLKLYDNKGLLARAAHILGLKDSKSLMDKVSRLLASNNGTKFANELSKILPVIPH